MKSLISISEFQDAFGVSRSTVYRLIERGEIECVRIGRAVRIRKEVADTWFSSLPTVGPRQENQVAQR